MDDLSVSVSKVEEDWARPLSQRFAKVIIVGVASVFANYLINKAYDSLRDGWDRSKSVDPDNEIVEAEIVEE